MDEQEYDLTVPVDGRDLIHVKGPNGWVKEYMN
jgi:hypothetical protein